jgi:hypothetical protein
MSGIPAADTGGQGEWATQAELQADVALLRKEMLQLEERLRKELIKEQRDEAEDDAVENAATDTQHALDVTQYKYSLESSVWDTIFFLGGSETSPAENAMLLFMTILTIAIQGLFCLIVNESMIDKTINETTLKELAMWRASVGHKVDHYDDLTGTSLVSRVCASAQSSIFATNQLQLADDLVAFREDSVTLTYKYMLAIIALVLWSLNCLEDLFSSFDMFRALISLPRGYWTILETTGDTKTFTSISRTRLISMIMWMVIPKFALAICLCYLGLVYLSYELNSVELILNVVAFAFVYQVDEIVYELFTPRRVKLIMARVQPLKIAVRFRSPQSWHRNIPLRGIVVLICMVGALAFAIPLLLQPTVEDAREAYRLMCGGNLNFVYAEDAATMVVKVAEVNQYETFIGNIDDVFKSYPVRATLQMAGLDLVNTLEASASVETLEGDAAYFETAVYYGVTDVSELTSMLLETFDDANAKYPCKDFTDAARSHIPQTRLAFRSVFAAADTCEDITGDDCLTKHGKAFCPETCKCMSPRYALLNREGCPQACDTLLDEEFTQRLEEEFTWEGACQDTQDTSIFHDYFEEAQRLWDEGMLVPRPMDICSGSSGLCDFTAVNLSAINQTLGELAARSMQPWRAVPGPLFSEDAAYATTSPDAPCSHEYAPIESLDECSAAADALRIWGVSNHFALDYTIVTSHLPDLAPNSTAGCWYLQNPVRLYWNPVGVPGRCEEPLDVGKCRTICKQARRRPGSAGRQTQESPLNFSTRNSSIELEWGLAKWGQCTDEPAEWVDSWGEGCVPYFTKGYCNSSGYGPGWESSWGNFSDWAVDGIDAGQACCACGGGNLSPPWPPQWNPNPCWFISFIYGIFKLDTCAPQETHPDLLGGRFGSLKHICPATCGYCSEPPSPWMALPGDQKYKDEYFNLGMALHWMYEAGMPLDGTKQTR